MYLDSYTKWNFKQIARVSHLTAFNRICHLCDRICHICDRICPFQIAYVLPSVLLIEEPQNAMFKNVPVYG